MNFGEKNVPVRLKYISSRSVKTSHRVGIIALYLGVVAIIVSICVIGMHEYKRIRALLDEIPDISEMEMIPKGHTTRVTDDVGKTIQTITRLDEDMAYADNDDIPENMKNAVLCAVDEDFITDKGIDLYRVIKSLIVGVTSGGDYQTGDKSVVEELIENQIIGNDNETSFTARLENAVKEQVMVLRMNEHYSKEEIFEYYMNTICLGQDVTGVEAAADRYFGKHVSDLSLSECAMIAAIVKNPIACDPIDHAVRNANRRLQVLTTMQKQGLITSDEYAGAIEDDVYSRIRKTSNVVSGKKRDTSYFTDALKDQVIADLISELGYSATQAVNALYTGGLTIESTLDQKTQKICDKIINDHEYVKSGYAYQVRYHLTLRHEDGSENSYTYADARKWYNKERKHKQGKYFRSKKKAEEFLKRYKKHIKKPTDKVIVEDISYIPQPQASCVIINPYTGQVKALCGGRGETLSDITDNRAVDMVRQPGVTLTPLSVYMPAIDTSGMTLATVADDTKYNYPGTKKEVKNFAGASYKGLTSIRKALVERVNTIAVKTLDSVTPRVGYDYLLNLGFTTLKDGYSDDEGRTYTDIALPMALGELKKGVTNLELTQGYAALANGGIYRKASFYSRVIDREGTVLLDRSDNVGRRICKASSAWLLTDAMLDTADDALAPLNVRKDKKIAVAGMYGSSNKRYNQWFVGYTPYLAGGVWIGDDADDITPHHLDDTYIKLWRDIMSQIHSGFEPIESFEKPADITMAKVCSKCGKLAIDGLCDEAVGGSGVSEEYFSYDSVPTETCDCHILCRICKSSGHLAGDTCPEETVYSAVYLKKKDEAAGEGKTADSAFIIPDYLVGSVCEVHR